MSVTNDAQIFEGVCVGELRAIIKDRGQIAGVRVEAYHLRLLCIAVKDFLRAYARNLFNMVCMWLGSLDMRQGASGKMHVGHQKNSEYR